MLRSARLNFSATREGATIKAVARQANVSKTTVSHVLSGKRPVAEETRRNVLRVMEELGFQPNYFARALSANRSLAVALIVQDLTNPFYPLLGRGLQREIGAAGYVVMLFEGAADPNAAEAAMKTSIQRRVDGVVIAAANASAAAQELEQAGIPVVAVGATTTRRDLDWVSADDERIGYDAVAHLLRAGHRRIATITGALDGDPGLARLAGYRRALAECGVGEYPDFVVEGGWTREGAATAAMRLLRRQRRPSALFCANDVMAVGALDAAHALELRAPEDVAIVGVDDIEAAGLVRPSLTTIRIPTVEIGRSAGALLLDRLANGGSAPPRHVRVAHELIVRQSG
jgi:LacI family transcriptional regulator